MAIGFGGYQANVVQLAIDQLHDASTAEIKSFINWYVWAAIGGGMLEHLAIPCITTSEENKNIFRLTIICICLSIALILNSFCSHWLVKEPIGQNPFKLVYKVIKYAIRTKCPRCRSAFTYCEDNLPSRIDFGKSKYGGPFTIKQVEDIKTFLRLLPIHLVGCAFGIEIVADNAVAVSFSFLFKEKLFNWSTGVISCGFWYFFQVLVVIIMISVFASVILKWYKN